MYPTSKKMPFDFAPLSECPEAIPQVARWWCDEWGLPQRHEFFDDYLSELANVKPREPPIHLLALSESRVVGWKPIKQVHLDGVEVSIMVRDVPKSTKGVA